MKTRALYTLLLLLVPGWALAQDLEFHPPPSATDPTVPAVMRDLADRILPVYQEKDPERYLRNLSVLQLVDGNVTAASGTRQSLRERRRAAEAHRQISQPVLYDIYFRARQLEAEGHIPFQQAFTQAFWEVVNKLSDEDDFILAGWLAKPPAEFRDALQRYFDQWRAKGTIPLADALQLLSTYVSFDAYRNFHPLVAGLEAEDDSRRYTTDWDVLIDTADGASISAVVVRPKDDTKSLTALLEFTIYVDARNLAKECAAHGYVGIVAFTRGERRSRGNIVPFERDGEDVRTVINWITHQTWSDGRVGMYGASYSAFTQWAAATRLPAGLKAMATNSATAPGIDFPMSGNILHNFAYRWSACVSDLPTVDENVCNDDAYWRSLDQTWYTSGRPYLELDQIFGKHNQMFRRWLAHPSYDRYWQKLIPFRKQFAHINIPVLATTGYYAAGEPGTLYYFTQHYKFNPHADQTLVIGPYDDSAPHAVTGNLRGFTLDQAAQIDLRELRYQWFDHIFKGADRPALLADRVNFEVMGANEWSHAPSIEAMGTGAVRFYLDAATKTAGHVLSQRKPADSVFVLQKVSLADRSDAASTQPFNIVSRSLDPHNALLFVSEPLRHSLEVAGLFSAKLDFTTNKMDVDLTMALYEQLANGDYIELFDPSSDLRASYAHDRVNRHLLRSGERQQLSFRSEHLTARRISQGSRLILMLGVNKRPDQQINYGTGGPISEESIDDGKVPVKLSWFGDSYIELPVRR